MGDATCNLDVLTELWTCCLRGEAQQDANASRNWLAFMI